MLRAALMAYDNYQRQGIGDGIFLATMGCFSRFVGEHLASFGTAGFDRGWWTYRQLSMRLFRTGELEYEFCPDEQTIHLHVPSDTRLLLPLCAASLEQFRRFAAEHCPDRAQWPVVIDYLLTDCSRPRAISAASRAVSTSPAGTRQAPNSSSGSMAARISRISNCRSGRASSGP